MTDSIDPEITQLFQRFRDGDASASEELIAAVYSTLRVQAAHEIRRRGPSTVIEATAMVHDVWIKMQGQDRDWESRGHFLGVAAKAMRRMLIDQGRKRASGPRRVGQGSEPSENPLDEMVAAFESDGVDLVALNQALEEFEEIDPKAAQLIELRFYAGARAEDAAAQVGLAPRTADRRFRYAKLWLKQRIEKKAS